MNRKLQHTMKALTATAAVFSLMLIAGGPAPVATPVPVAVPGLLVVSAEAVEAIEAGAEATPSREAGSRQRRGHATVALPYFSFAQGLRQVTGS